MNADILNDLAARVEALDGADRGVDAEIAVMIDGGEILWLQANYTMEIYPARKYQSTDHVGGYGKAPVPAYTAFIDAAMTLLPKGWVVGEMSWWPHAQSSTVHMDNMHGLKACSGAISLPLALTAAALRAHAAIAKENER